MPPCEVGAAPAARRARGAVGSQHKKYRYIGTHNIKKGATQPLGVYSFF